MSKWKIAKSSPEEALLESGEQFVSDGRGSPREGGWTVTDPRGIKIWFLLYMEAVHFVSECLDKHARWRTVTLCTSSDELLTSYEESRLT